jgi:hypothetical protein
MVCRVLNGEPLRTSGKTLWFFGSRRKCSHPAAMTFRLSSRKASKWSVGTRNSQGRGGLAGEARPQTRDGRTCGNWAEAEWWAHQGSNLGPAD